MKLTVLMMAISVLAVCAPGYAQMTTKDKKSLDITFTVGGNLSMPNTVELYDAPIDGHLVTDFESSGAMYTANTNKRVLLVGQDGNKLYFEVKPQGLFDVSIYTINLDPDGNRQLDVDDYWRVEGVFFHGRQLQVPPNWDTMTKVQKANWITQYGGLLHHDFMHFMPLKCRSEAEIGVAIGNSWREELENDGVTIKDEVYRGEDPTFFFIPESVAVDPAWVFPDEVGEPDWGTYRRVIAGTMLGTNVSRRYELCFAVDLLTAGKGTYSSTVVLELRSN
ncbi:MAG: hypothetical protein AB1454_02820 [Candidatus Auribacterota bacterium]